MSEPDITDLYVRARAEGRDPDESWKLIWQQMTPEQQARERAFIPVRWPAAREAAAPALADTLNRLEASEQRARESLELAAKTDQIRRDMAQQAREDRKRAQFWREFERNPQAARQVGHIQELGREARG